MSLSKRTTRSFVTLLISLMLWQTVLPGVIAHAAEQQSLNQEATEVNTGKGSGTVIKAEAPSEAEDVKLAAEAPLKTEENPLESMNGTANTLGLMITGERKLKINGIDALQLQALEKLAEQIALNPEVGKQYTAGNLPKDLAERINIKALATFDSKLIRSLIHLVTPVEQGGAGHEFLDVVSLSRGHRTEKDKLETNEGAPPEGEDPKLSTHYYTGVKAADVGAIDYLHGTEFTIETKDGKPTVKSTKRLPNEPIQVAWQTTLQPVGSRDGGSPRLNGGSTGGTVENGIKSLIGHGLQQGLDRAGADINLGPLLAGLGSFGNLGELAKQLGDGYLPEVLGSQTALFAGPYGLRQTGQAAIHQAFDGLIPAFGFYGENLPELEYYSGAQTVATTLGMAEGALLGKTSGDVIKNAGERFWETQLGDLPLGTLDGTKTDGSPEERRADLERRVGRGRVAKLLGLDVGSLPLGASPAAFQAALGLAWDELQASGHTFSHQLGIPTEDSIAAIKQNPDAWLQRIGRIQLGALEAYLPDARDNAFNLSARPTVIELPIGTTQEKATQLLDRYAFKSGVAAELERLKTGGSSTAVDLGDDTTLRAWLVANAYQKGTDPNQPQISDKFLASDPFAFYDTGIEVLAKALSADNDTRQGLRTYLRTGQEPADGTLDLPYVAQTTGFLERSSFDAVFRNNAPAVGFSHVGRVGLNRALSSSATETAQLLAKPVPPTTDQLKERLQQIREVLVATRRTDITIRPQVTDGLAAADTLLAAVDRGERPGITGSAPASWLAPLGTLQQAVQAAANSGQTGLAQVRDLLIATNSLFAQSGAGTFESSDLNFRVPGGARGNRLLLQVLEGDLSPTNAAEQIGGFALDETLNVSGTYALQQSVRSQLAARDTAGAVAAIAQFASRYDEDLAGIVSDVDSAVRQFSTPLSSNPQTLMRQLLSGWKLATNLGTRILDGGLGMSRTAPLGTILETQNTANISNAVFTSIGTRQLEEQVGGINAFNPRAETELGDRLFYSRLAAETNLPLTPNGPDVGDDPAAFMGLVLGHPLRTADLVELGVPDSTPAGLEQFIETWRYWEDPDLIPRLDRMTAPINPDSEGDKAALRGTLFDRTVPSDERTRRLQGVIKPKDDIDSILVAQKPKSEKTAALEALGRAAADSYITTQFGFPIGWLMDANLGPKEKIRIGLAIASQQMGLDPSLTTLVNQAWQTFYIDGGIDTTTAAGRTQLAGLVGAVGSAAGVPTEYAGVAAAFITGDVEATALAYAGGQFNQILQENGIFTVGFGDIYEGIAGPNKATTERLKLEVAAELESKFPGDAKDQHGDIYEAYSNDLYDAKLTKYRAAKQDQLMFAGMDLALAKATGAPGLGGMAHAFMRGTSSDQAAATVQLLGTAINNPTIALAAGAAGVLLSSGDIQKQFNEFVATGDTSKIPAGAFTTMDSWLGQATGAPIPPGTSEAVIGFSASGDVGRLESVVNADLLVAMGGGYLDQAVDLPAGATATLYNAYQNMDAAQQVYNASHLNDLAQAQGLGGGASAATSQAATNLATAQAGLISAGVAIVFGETFAKLDNSLGLPSGTLSTLVSTGIYAAMVPGIALGQLLMTTVLPWAAPLLLAAIFGIDLGSIFGGLFGGGKKATTQKFILWSSYTGKWPEEIEYLCRPKGMPAPPNDDKRPKGQQIERDAGSQGLLVCEVGKEIVFATELPPGVFYGPPPSNVAPNYEAGKYAVANAKAETLIGNLMGMSIALDDEEMAPLQIRSHKKEHGETQQALMDHFQLWGDGDVGSYFDETNEGLVKQRTGYIYDEPNKVPYFTGHVHWNY